MQSSYIIPMLDGTEIFVRVQGEGYPLVFLHGNSMDSHYFDGQVDYFSHHYQVILVDNRGHGQSNIVSGDISFKNMTEDLNQVFDYLGISEALVIGHSDGANLALVFQQAYPQKVAGLVLNAGNWRYKGLKIWFRMFSKLLYSVIFLLASIFPRYRRRKAVTRLVLEDLPITKNDLKAVSIPVLVVVGEYDVIRKPHSKKMANLFPHGEFRSLRGLKHNLAYKHAQIFNLILRKFIKEVIREKES